MALTDEDVRSTVSEWRKRTTPLNLLEYVAVGWTFVSLVLLLIYGFSHVASHRPFFEGALFLIGVFFSSGLMVCFSSTRVRQYLSKRQ